MRKRYKIPLIFLGIILFFLLVFYLLVTQTKFVETQVSRYLSTLVDKDTPVQVEIGRLRFFVWGEVILEDLQIDYTQKGLEYTLLKLKRLELNFDLLDFLKRRWNFSQVGLYQPRVQIKQTQDGKLLIPSLKKKKLTQEGGSDFSILFFLLKDGSLDWLTTERSFHLDGLNLNFSLNKDKNGLNFNLLNGSLYLRAEDTLSFKKFNGEARLKTDTLFIEKLMLHTVDSGLELKKGNLVLKPFSFSVDLKGEPILLSDIKKLAGIDLEGKLTLEGSVEGDLKRIKGDLVLNGDLFDKDLSALRTDFLYEKGKFTFYSLRGKAFNSTVQLSGGLNLAEKPESYFLKGKVNNLNITNVALVQLQSDLSGNIDMKGRGFKEKDLKLDFDLDLEEGKFDLYSFSKAKGNLSVFIDKVELHKDFQFWYKNTEITGEGNVGFSDSLSLRGKAIFKDLSDFRGQTFIQELSGRGVFEFKAYGPITDFSLEGDFESDSIWGYSLFSSALGSDVKIEKFISKRGGMVKLSLLEGSAWGISYDSLSSEILLEGDSIFIDSTRLINSSLTLSFYGNLDVSKYPQNLTLEEVNLNYRGNKIESEKPARIEIDKEEVRFTQNSFKVDGGDFSLLGKIDYKENMDLKLGFKDISLSPWLRFLFPARRIDGSLDGSLSLGGEFKAPKLELYAEIRDINYENVELGFLSGRLSYKEKRLFLDKISLLHPDGEYALSGFVPFELSFNPFVGVLLDQPQKIIFKGRGNRFSLINLFIPQVEYLQGEFKAGVSITGSPVHPRFEGEAELHQGTLKLVPLKNPINQVRGKLRMENENLFIEELRGFASHEKISRDNLLKSVWHFFFPKKKIEGEAFLYGNINLGDIKKFNYNLYLIARNFPLSYEYADLSGATDLNLEISGDDPPLVSGEIFFSNLAFRDPFSSLIQTKAGPPVPRENLWDLRITLSGDNNLWVLNQDMQAEFKGEILLSRNNGDLGLLGNLEIIRGKYFLYGTIFKIEKGDFIFDDIQKIDPRLDFLVFTSLNGSAYSPEDSLSHKEQELKVAISGTLSAPELKPAPGSAYSKEEIAELLAFHQRFTTAETEGSSLFQYRLAGSLGEAYANRFLENLATRSIGVETFEIKPLEPGKFSLWESEVTVGKYLSEKIYFRYTRRLSESSGQEAGLEYRLSKRLYLEGYRDKQGLFHLGLNLFWEY